MIEFSYKADGQVLKEFIKDRSFFSGIMGPIGSGKTVGMIIKALMISLEQEKSRDGLRKTRWCVVRNTNPQLRTTIMKSWADWFPEEAWGKIKMDPPFTHYIRQGDLDMEVIFLALDRPEDVKRLLSLEVTGFLVNEAREIPKSLIDGMTGRVGRYPSMKDGVGPTWNGIICDTNAPEEDHWWPIMAGMVPPPDWMTRDDIRNLVKPQDWRFFQQPPGLVEKRDEKTGEVMSYELNPDRENGKFVKMDYYTKAMQGKQKQWIDVYIMNRLGSAEDGKPVYPMFSPTVHKAKEPIPILDGHPVHVGMDFGLTPAAVFAQKIRGRWLIQREIVSFDMAVTTFAGLVKEELALHYPNSPVVITGDPAGDYRAQTDADTPFRVLKANGLKARPASSNDPALRIEAVSGSLGRLVQGEGGLLIDPAHCPYLVKGFEGGYRYRRLQVSGERYEDKPDKNIYSHIHDALQYLMLGAGEGKALVRSGRETQSAFDARQDYDIFRRQAKTRRRTSKLHMH